MAGHQLSLTSLLLLLLAALLLLPTARAQVECAAGIDFHPSGTVHRCELTANQRFRLGEQWLVCAAGNQIVLYPGGGLERCTLAEPLSTPVGDCAAGASVELSADGRLSTCIAGS